MFHEHVMKLKVDKNRYSTSSFVRQLSQVLQDVKSTPNCWRGCSSSWTHFLKLQAECKTKGEVSRWTKWFFILLLKFLSRAHRDTRTRSVKMLQLAVGRFLSLFSAHNGKWYECSAKSLKTQRLRLWMTHCCSCSNGEKKLTWVGMKWSSAFDVCEGSQDVPVFFSLLLHKNSIFQNLWVRNSLIGIIMVCLLSLEGSILIRLPSSLLCWPFTQCLADWTLWMFFVCSRRFRQVMRVRVIWSEETFSLGSSLDNTIDWKFI